MTDRGRAGAGDAADSEDGERAGVVGVEPHGRIATSLCLMKTLLKPLSYAARAAGAARNPQDREHF
jgi:hypothetical protein